MRRLLTWLAKVTLGRIRKVTDNYAAQPAHEGAETVTQQVTRLVLRWVFEKVTDQLDTWQGVLHPVVQKNVSYKLRDLLTDLTAPNFSNGSI